jgi:hypothetical protein
MFLRHDNAPERRALPDRSYRNYFIGLIDTRRNSRPFSRLQSVLPSDTPERP